MMRREFTNLILIMLFLSFPLPAASASIEQLSEGMIKLIKGISEQRHSTGMLKRFNQAKSLGCFNADFEVLADSPDNLHHGLFAKPGTYKAMVRFASASQVDDREKDLRGMSIKVLDVEGETIMGDAGVQDFLLNSYPALFVSTPEDFYTFIKSVHEDKIWKFFVNPFDPHLKSLWILLKARKNHSSPFDIRYWSTTPSRLGLDGKQIVKYSTTPCSTSSSDLPDKLHSNYLQNSMHSHLKRESVCFDFQVQLQTDEDEMSVEDSSVIWDEDKSPFIKLARLTIRDQPFKAPDALVACEKSTFNPWQSLVEHKPVGRMNLVRKNVYAVISEFRTDSNTTRASWTE